MRDNQILLDSSVIIRHLRNPSAMVQKLISYGELFVPEIALGELYSRTLRSANAERNLRKVKDFMAGATLALTNQDTPFIYAQVAAQLPSAGKPIPQNDMWIAALALQMELPVATLDQHYTFIPTLKVALWGPPID